MEMELPCENGTLRGSARGSRARVVHCLREEIFNPFRNGAPVREWCASRECAGLPCENGALHGSSQGSRARAVHILSGEFFAFFRNGAPVREWCTSREFTGLPCESGAHFVRGVFRAFSKRSSRARVVHFAEVRGAPVREWCTFLSREFFEPFRNMAPVREWCTSREFAGLPCKTGQRFVR